MQTSDFDELLDTQKLIEFAVTSSANQTSDIAEITDFEPGQMLQPSYLEGPVIKIEEFSAEDEALLCYMTQPSHSASAVSDSSEQNLSFAQSPVPTSAAATRSSTLTFPPLTLTVDGSALDSCSALQFS